MMDYGRLGERQRRLRMPVLEILSALLLLGAIVLAMLELVAYSNQKDSLPTDLTIADIPLGGMSESAAQVRLEAIYVDQPVQLLYNSSPIWLDPAEINFSVNADAMLAEARAQSSREKNFWLGFWNYLERRPVAAVTVPLTANYDPGDLRKYLEELAARYDTSAAGPGFDPATLTFRSGQAGRRLDVDAALPLVDVALHDPRPENRRVVLPTADTAAQGTQDISTLRQAILDLMARMNFDYAGAETLASVYIMDLATGDEVSILPDVVHSSTSVVKIPIMLNLFRQELLVNQTEAYWLTESILCSNNASSNFLMQAVGQGNTAEAQLRDGLNQVSCTAQHLGATHTYISAPLYVADRAYEFETAVCRPKTPGDTTYNTNPDLYNQTTARDMGGLLTAIYDCANNGTGLRVALPGDYTPTECQQMIEVMSGNRIDRLMELGTPPGTKIAHKNGWGRETSADAGIVFSPGGDYVFVMFVWEKDTDGNNLPTIFSWEVIEEVSRLTYNFFNPEAPLLQRREPINAFTAIDCVTVGRPEDVNLNDVNANRLDADGNPLPTACYGGAGDCRPFEDWSH